MLRVYYLLRVAPNLPLLIMMKLHLLFRVPLLLYVALLYLFPPTYPCPAAAICPIYIGLVLFRRMVSSPKAFLGQANDNQSEPELEEAEERNRT